MMVIFNNPNLTHLDVKNCDISLIQSFPVNNHLISLSLCHCGLTDDSALNLTSSLAKNSDSLALKSLKLSGNHISHVGINSIFSVLHSLPTLRELDFRQNYRKNRGESSKGNLHWHHISNSRVEKLYFGLVVATESDGMVHYINKSYVRYLEIDTKFQNLSELNGTCIFDSRNETPSLEICSFLD